jgi:hypothetical protein
MFTAAVIKAILTLLEKGMHIPFIKPLADELSRGVSTPTHLCVKYLHHFIDDRKIIAEACGVTDVYVKMIITGRYGGAKRGAVEAR